MDSEMTTLKPQSQPKEWSRGQANFDLTRPDGSQINLVVSSHVRRTSNILHIYNELDGISYDIPSDGDFNLVLHSNENGQMTPLAAASIEMENNIPTVTMIQRVTSRVEKDDTPPPSPDDLIQILAVFDKVPHPKADLLQGENKIEWQQTLLEQCEKVVKNQGYSRLRLRSGFASKYATVGHNLPLAVQQYDYLVNNSPDWSPIDIQGKKIIEQRQELSRIIKQTRDRKFKSLDEIKMHSPSTLLPTVWEKVL